MGYAANMHYAGIVPSTLMFFQVKFPWQWKHGCHGEYSGCTAPLRAGRRPGNFFRVGQAGEGVSP